jgi:TonB family protein
MRAAGKHVFVRVDLAGSEIMLAVRVDAGSALVAGLAARSDEEAAIGGVAGGVVGGVLGSEAGPKWVPSSTLKRAGGEPVPPVTPELRRRLDADGVAARKIAVRLCVSTEGRVSEARMLQSSGLERYDGQLLEAVRSWRFEPHLENGVAAAVCTTIVVRVVAP